MRFCIKVLLGILGFLVLFTSVSHAKPNFSGVDITPFLKEIDTLSPTPKGLGAPPILKSGETVQIRYALPKNRPMEVWLDFHNIAASRGNGGSYQLQLRRDNPNGKILYEGPTLLSSAWNSENHQWLNVTDRLSDADLQRGYLDIFATAHVDNDDWTLYCDSSEGNGAWDIRTLVLEDSPRLQKKMEQARVLREKKINLIPMPRQIEPQKSNFIITTKSRILLSSSASEDDLFTAGLLQAEIRHLSGFTLPIRKGVTKSQKTDLLLGVKNSVLPGDQSYRLDTGGCFRASANTSTGLFYAVQTAVQLLNKQGKQLTFQGISIQDKPDLTYRMVQYDIARYQTINMDYWKRVIREMSRFKINQILLYMEDDYKYKKYPFTGRPGTFTPETAKELVAYARKYHVELVPQLEAFFHGKALLSHPEFTDLRENGDLFTFCTSNPRTWEVLDNMVGELSAVFNNTPYIHLGADEFENTYGQCPACKAQVAKIGYGGLYAQHINKLNEIARKYNRTLLIWTSHGGRRPEVKEEMTVKYANLLPKDAIPMEWVYDGPSRYPSLTRYKNAGYTKFFVAPAINGYSRIYPNYESTFRAISGLYRAGVDEKAMGGCTCTWELSNGAQFETNWFGLIYSAQCGWNSEASDISSFERSFAAQWLRLNGEVSESTLHHLFWLDKESQNDAVAWSTTPGASSVLWTKQPALRKKIGFAWSYFAMKAPEMIRSADETLSALNELKGKSTRNQITLDAIVECARMYRTAYRRVLTVDQAGNFYRKALSAKETGNSDGIQSLDQCIAALELLKQDLDEIGAGLDKNRTERGGSTIDPENLKGIQESQRNLLDRLKSLSSALKAGQDVVLPKAEDLGF